MTLSELHTLEAAVDDAFERRSEPGRRLSEDAGALALACKDMALRFHGGGRLIVFGNGAASADAQHIAVEFVHPVIIGKRALPAFALSNDPAVVTAVANRSGFGEIFAHQLPYVADPRDIALGISADGRCEDVRRGLQVAAELGLLTIALLGGDGGRIAAESKLDHVLFARTDDPRVAKEVHVTIYHVLWELVHVFFEQPGVLAPEVIA